MVNSATTKAPAPAKYDKDTDPHVRPSRVGLKTVVTYVDPDISKALRHLAIEKDMTLQALGEEAFDLLLQHYGVKVKKSK